MIALLTVALGAITVDDPPVVGVETLIRVTGEDGSEAGGETVRVLYLPSTARTRERAINITDARGRVRWTPERSGVAEIRAGTQSVRIYINSERLPTTPLAVFAVLALLGAGSVGYGLRRRRQP